MYQPVGLRRIDRVDGRTIGRIAECVPADGEMLIARHVGDSPQENVVAHRLRPDLRSARHCLTKAGKAHACVLTDVVCELRICRQKIALLIGSHTAAAEGVASDQEMVRGLAVRAALMRDGRIVDIVEHAVLDLNVFRHVPALKGVAKADLLVFIPDGAADFGKPAVFDAQIPAALFARNAVQAVVAEFQIGNDHVVSAVRQPAVLRCGTFNRLVENSGVFVRINQQRMILRKREMLNGISKAGIKPVALLAKLLACPAQRAARSVAVDQVGRLTGKHAGKPPDASADVFPLCRVGKALGAAEHRRFTLAIRAVMDGMLPAAGRILQRPAEHAAASEQNGIVRLKQLRVLRPERRFGTQAVIFVAAVLKINKICRHFYTIFSIIRKKLIGKAEETECLFRFWLDAYQEVILLASM